jgi:hypothetical protein
MGSLEQLALVKELLDVDPLKLNRVRLINVDMADADLSVLFRLAALGGVDDSGLDTDMAVITGRFYAVSAMEGDIANCRALYPELEIEVGTELEDPTTVFEFVSSQNLPLNYVLFNPSIPFTKIDDTHYSVKAVAGTVITFVIEAENHEGYAGTYEVTYTRTRRYSLIYVPVRPVVFKNVTNNNPLEGVVVHVDNETYISDVDGTAYIRKREAFTATGILEDFGNATFSMNESSTDTAAITVSVYPYVDVEFIVRTSGVFLTNGTFLPGVTVIFNGETKMTDIKGAVAFRASYGTYDYEVFLHEDNKTTGRFSVATTTIKGYLLNVPVAIDDIKPVLDGSTMMLHVYHSNLSIAFSYMADSAFTIDWGDGETQTLEPTSGTSMKSASHTYSINQSIRLLKLIGCEGVSYFLPTASSPQYCFITALWTIGNSKYNYSFQENSNLVYLGIDTFKNAVSLTSLNGCIRSCYNLKYLPDGIFDGLVNVTTAIHAISYTRGLPRLPAHLFADMVNLQSVCSCLTETHVEEFDNDLFRNHRKINDISSLFQDSKKVKHIGRGVLPIETDAPITTTAQAFYRCVTLETVYIPACITLFQYYFIYSCPLLKYIEMESETPPSIVSNAIGANNDTFVIYVPDAAVDAYRSATNWSTYSYRILPVSQKPAQ